MEHRIADIEILRQEIDDWEQQRNHQKVKIDWRFAASDARLKFQRLYPDLDLS